MHRNRVETIETLKSKLLASPAPSTRMRLQLADMMVMAGKGVEAIPLLIEISDDFATDGFLAKAIAILKRVEKIQPGREDVAIRLSNLVGEQVRLTPSVIIPPQGLPETGFEDILKEIERDAAALESAAESVAPFLDVAFLDDDTQRPLVARATLDRSTMPAHRGSSDVVEDYEAFMSSSIAASLEEERSDEEQQSVPSLLQEQLKVESADTDQAAGQVDEARDVVQPEGKEGLVATRTDDETARGGPSVGHRIRAVLRRFLSSLPVGAHAADKHAPESAALAEAARQEERIAEELKPSMQPLAQPSEGWEGAAPLSFAEEPSVEISPESEETELRDAFAPAADELLSDEEFHSRVMDLVEDVLRRPSEARPVEDESRRANLGARLVATPIFSELSEEELRAVVAGLELRTFESGDVLVTEGEPGQSLWILTSGQTKVFVRNPAGRDVEVARLEEGDFFGELSALSGRRRSATITATCACEVLELDKSTLDEIARRHNRVRETLEAIYIKRASSPEAAAVRAVNLPGRHTKQKAIEALEAYFGESRWRPRMRLRLADVLLKAGKHEAAVPVLVGLAEDLAKAGYPEKAIALLKKIERIQRRHVVEIRLAPRRQAMESGSTGEASEDTESGTARETTHPNVITEQQEHERDSMFHDWLLRLARDGMPALEIQGDETAVDQESARTALRHYGPGLRASPLFESLSEDELLAVVRGMRLLSYEPGDIILTEGEEEQSVFVLVVGSVSVSVRDPRGHNVKICRLDEGAFFGEISMLTGRPRCATVTAIQPSELLELDKATLDRIVVKHPRVFQVLDEHCVTRASSADAAQVRAGQASRPISRPRPIDRYSGES